MKKKNQNETDKNTGSQLYQLKIFLNNIKDLQKHVAKNKHDYQAKRNLTKNVNKKNRVLAYLSNNNKYSELYDQAMLLCGKKKKEVVK